MLSPGMLCRGENFVPSACWLIFFILRVNCFPSYFENLRSSTEVGMIFHQPHGELFLSPNQGVIFCLQKKVPNYPLDIYARCAQR